jgi:hypothetical protein
MTAFKIFMHRRQWRLKISKKIKICLVLQIIFLRAIGDSA